MSNLESYYPEYFRDGIFFTKLHLKRNAKDEDLFIIIGKLYELVSRYNLTESFQDLYNVAVIISNEWNRVESLLEMGSDSIKLQAKDANTLSIALKRMIEHYDSNKDFIKIITEIKFEGGFSITNPEIIRQYIGDIDIKSIFYLMEERKKLLCEMPELRKIPSMQKGFICSTLLPFFNYLNEGIMIHAKSENVIYRFIHEFCIIAGANLNIIYTQKPEDYLKRTFNRCLNK